MLFLFGTRTTRTRQAPLAVPHFCPNCGRRNTFDILSSSTYFHFFFIPMFPFMKSNDLICKECGKKYQLSAVPDIAPEIRQELRLNPARRPIWQAFGCLSFLALAALLSIFVGIAYIKHRNDPPKKVDPRETMLNDDMTKVSASPNASTDPLGCRLKSCLNVSLLGLKNEELQIYTRQNEDKVLILIAYEDILGVSQSSRKVMVETVEDCYKLGNLQYPKKY